jgi:hypothetical protein
VLQLRHDVPAASWTIVMTSGVVSIDLSRDHQAVLSAIMAWFAALGLAVPGRDGGGAAGLLIPILRQWKTPTTGISFVVGVATDGLALLSATLAIAFRAGWLVSVAVVFLLLGLALYVFTAARFDLRQLLTGMGDHWIAGGALAISALAAGVITQAAGMLGQFTQQHQVLTTGTLVLWSLALAWVPVLLVCEAVRPRLQ